MEVVPAGPAAARSDEQQGVWVWTNEPVEVLTQVGQDHLGEHDQPTTARRLWIAVFDLAAVTLDASRKRRG